MKRDFALRIDSLLAGVRASLSSISDYMSNNVARGNISAEERHKYLGLIGQCLVDTINFSNDLYRMFPDIVPDELKSDPPPNKP
jgi:hypothetical protein